MNTDPRFIVTAHDKGVLRLVCTDCTAPDEDDEESFLEVWRTVHGVGGLDTLTRHAERHTAEVHR